MHRSIQSPHRIWKNSGPTEIHTSNLLVASTKHWVTVEPFLRVFIVSFSCDNNRINKRTKESQRSFDCLRLGPTVQDPPMSRWLYRLSTDFCRINLSLQYCAMLYYQPHHKLLLTVCPFVNFQLSLTLFIIIQAFLRLCVTFKHEVSLKTRMTMVLTHFALWVRQTQPA